MDLYPGSPPLRVVFKPNPVTARGTVANGANSQVVFLPQDEALRGEHSVRAVPADAAGRFTVSGLAPGAYYAFAFDRLRSTNPLYNPGFIHSLVSQAVRVELHTGESSSVDLKVTRWPD
jgi:hypothetical protein